MFFLPSVEVVVLLYPLRSDVYIYERELSSMDGNTWLLGVGPTALSMNIYKDVTCPCVWVREWGSWAMMWSQSLPVLTNGTSPCGACHAFCRLDLRLLVGSTRRVNQTNPAVPGCFYLFIYLFYVLSWGLVRFSIFVPQFYLPNVNIVSIDFPLKQT